MKKNESRMNIFEIKYGLDYIISNSKETEDTKTFNELLIDARTLIDVLITSDVNGKKIKYRPSVIIDFLNALADEISTINNDDGYTSKLFRDTAVYINNFIK